MAINEQDELALWESMFGNATRAKAGNYSIDYKEFMSRVAQHTKKAVEVALRDSRQRRQLPMTQDDLAKFLGISRPTLSKWLDNPGMMTLDAVKRLSELATPQQSKDKEK